MDAFWWPRESAFDRGMSLFYSQDEERTILRAVSETIKKGILLSRRFDLSNLPSFLPSFPIVAKNAQPTARNTSFPLSASFSRFTRSLASVYTFERLPRIKRKSVDTIEITRWIAHLIFTVFNNSFIELLVEDIRSRTNMECCSHDIKWNYGKIEAIFQILFPNPYEFPLL